MPHFFDDDPRLVVFCPLFGGYPLEVASSEFPIVTTHNMKERVKLRIDGCVVEVSLIEDRKGYDDVADVPIRHWSVRFDDPIEFDEHTIPKVDVQKRGVWIKGCSIGIPKKGGSTTGFISFPEPE